MKISILIPVYNEDRTITQLLLNVLKADLGDNQREIIVIDDGSTDMTECKLKEFSSNIKILKHIQNLGKGAALKTGFLGSTGDIIIVQDADLEYNPEDIFQLIAPFQKENVDIVIGKRCLAKVSIAHHFTPFYFGGRIINIFFNILSPVKLSDIHSGYKLARRNAWSSLNLTENGFNFCHEFLSKSVLNKLEITEVLISYKPRNKAEGKKISAKDGICAAATIAKIFSKYRVKKIITHFQQTNT